jgi:hypothetical protein
MAPKKPGPNLPRDKKTGRFVPRDKSQSTLYKAARKATKNPIDNLPPNVGGRDQYGRFTPKDPYRKEADKLFPPNKTDDVEELVSPRREGSRGPRDHNRKPHERRPRIDEFYNDPIDDLGTTDQKKIQAAIEQREKQDQRIKKKISEAVLKNIQNRELRDRKKEAKIRKMQQEALNDNVPEPTQEELLAERGKHLHGNPSHHYQGTTKPRPANENHAEPTQDELRALRDKHLANAKRPFKNVNQKLDPANDNRDEGGYARKARRSDPFSRFQFRQKPNFARTSGGNGGSQYRGRAFNPGNLPAAFTGNVGPYPQMRTVNGKVTFRKPKKPRVPKRKQGKDDEPSIVMRIVYLTMGIIGMISGAMSLIKTILQNYGNMLIDNLINPVLKLFGFTPMARMGKLDTPSSNAMGERQQGQPNVSPDMLHPNTPATIPTEAASSPGPGKITPAPTSRPVPAQSAVGSNNVINPSVNPNQKPAPGVGDRGAAPGAEQYQQSVREKGSQSQAIQILVSKGWTRPQAAGIAGNLMVESNFRTNAIGDNGQAYGIAQWHPDRQAVFKQIYGKDIRNSTFEEQLNFVHYELTEGQEQRAGNILKNTTDAGQAASVVDQFYERSSGEHRSRRIQYAQQFMGGNENAPTPNQNTEVAQNLTPTPNPASGGQQGGGVTAAGGAVAPPSISTGYASAVPTTYGGPVTNNYGSPVVSAGNRPFPGGYNNTPVSPTMNLFQYLLNQSGNLRQGKLHPFSLPGMSTIGGINPMQLLADASPGGKGGLTNIVNRIFNSPAGVQGRINLPDMIGMNTRMNIPGVLTPPTFPQQPNFDPLTQQMTTNNNTLMGSFGQAMSSLTSSIMGGLTQLGAKIDHSSTITPSINQIHIRDPNLSKLDQSSAFQQRDMLRPNG